MSKIQGFRKTIVAIIVIITSTVLVYNCKITDIVYRDIIKVLICVYMTGNILEHGKNFLKK